jgi:hypothetical protein
MQAAEKGLAGNLIQGDDLERILTGYLKSIEVSQARTVARLLIEQLVSGSLESLASGECDQQRLCPLGNRTARCSIELGRVH